MALRPLIVFIEQEKVAVIGIMHTNKNQMADALHRISEAAGWAQVSRVIWVIARDRNDPELRWFLALKNNTVAEVEKRKPEFGFRILDNHIVVAADEQPIGIEEAVGPELPEDATERRGKMKEASAFLEEQKAKGTKEISAQEAMGLFLGHRQIYMEQGPAEGGGPDRAKGGGLVLDFLGSYEHGSLVALAKCNSAWSADASHRKTQSREKYVCALARLPRFVRPPVARLFGQIGDGRRGPDTSTG
jgi:hypothetical protein